MDDGAGGTGPVDQPVTLQAEVAWRAAPTSDGGVVVVHQEAVQDEIRITKPSATDTAYGVSGFNCSGLIRDAISVIGANGTVISRRRLVASPLPVDIAVSPNGQDIAFAVAGMRDPDAPEPEVRFPDGSSSLLFGFAGGPGFGGVGIMESGTPDDSCVFPTNSIFDTAAAVAVAYTPNGALIAQKREPPSLFMVPAIFGVPGTGSVQLPGDSRLDTGHEIFHRDTGGGIACASCHPEGAEDGHIWHFSDVGKRRTQALHVGLGATAPFHWNGDLKDIGALMTEVFVGRMGGVNESPERLDALTAWLYGLKRPPAIRDSSDAAAGRGAVLFNSADVGCASCHAGDHGRTSQLSAEQKSDLVAYLESL